MALLSWDNNIVKSNTDEVKTKNSKKEQLTPKQFWMVFEQYLKCRDEEQSDALLKQLCSCNYPPITYLIDSLAYDYNYRVYFNDLINHQSQTWLYQRKNIFRLLKQLYQTGFFIWIPKKAYQYVSKRAKELFPWLNSQELQIIDQYIDVDKVEKEKVDKQQQKSTKVIKNDKAESKIKTKTKIKSVTVKEQVFEIDYDKLIQETAKSDECITCPHFNQPQVFGDVKDVTKAVDILFVGEAPHTEEVQQGKPFVGSSGRILRSIIDEEISRDLNWAIWNASLCKVLPKKANLDKAIECCRRNLEKAIQTFSPKVIILLGGSAYQGLFGENPPSISQSIGKTLNKDGRSILLTYHPAAALHNPAQRDIVINAIRDTVIQAKEMILHGAKLNYSIISNKPDWFSEYIAKGWKLLDIQDFDNVLIYVFKDSQNRRHIVKKLIDGKTPCFYYYQRKSTEPIVEMNKCSLVVVNDLYSYRQCRYDENGYHADIPLSTRHAIDYYLQAKSAGLDQDYKLRIGYVDIEVLPEDRVTFPNEETAQDPIVAISFTIDEGGELPTVFTWFLQNKEKPVLGDDTTKIFESEYEMLIDFLKFVQSSDPDIIAGWNIFFDLNYIITRCKGLNINVSKYLSPVNKVVVDRQRKYVFIGGRIVVDMLHTYKQLTFERKTSYALNYIANEELGHGKVQFEGPLMTLYDRDPELFLKYNKQDVLLLVELERKLTYIYFMDELRKLIKGTWLNLVSTSSQCDTMLVSHLEEKGYVAQAKKYSGKQDVFKGAFVFQPKPGIREWVFDLDYASLYPNIIRSFNIGIDTFYAFIPSEDLVMQYLFGDKSKIAYIPIIYDPLHNSNVETISVSELDQLREKCLLTPNGCLFLRQKEKRSILYDLLDLLLKERKKYKKLKAEAAKQGDKDAKQKYHVMQWTYKIIANSFYGYLGFEHSRIHDRRVAASITSVGRIVIKSGLAIAEQLVEQIRNPDFKLDIRQEVLKDDFDYKHVVYSDTDSIFLTLENLKDAIDIEQFLETELSKLENDIDNSVRVFLRNQFHLDEVYFELKNEWVARRFLQTSRKKRYAYLLYKDDKIKVVGIEVKRSDQPPPVRKLLEQLLEFLLKHDNLTIDSIAVKLDEFTNEYKQMLISRLTEAGKPMAANFDKDNLPQCRAAKNWNMLEYEYFKQGTRGFYFHLAGIDVTKTKKNITKVKDILVPPEVATVPDYYVIDVERMVTDYWLKKVEAILTDIAPNVIARLQKTLSATAVNIMTW